MKLFKQLKETIEETKTPAGRIFDLTIQVLVLVSIITFTIETLPNLSTSSCVTLRHLEVFIVSVFTIEYLLRFIVADNKVRFIFRFTSIIDLLAILPFYLSTGIDLRSLRIFRLFRLFRLLKLARYTNAIDHFINAFKVIKDELKVFMIAMIFMLYLSSVGIYYFENPAQPEVFSSVLHSLWWSVATLTTVGYGDIYPITAGGKIFTFVILLLGLGIVGVPTALLTSAFQETTKKTLNRDLK